MKKFIRLFACCLPVKGYKQSLIYDLQRPTNSNIIPNDLFEILDKYGDRSVDDVKELYAHQYDEIIDGYYTFLLSNEFAYTFQEEEIQYFPPIENIWESPSEITNSIIFVSKDNISSIRAILEQLSELRCDAVQFCIVEKMTIPDIKDLCAALNGLRILSVEILLNYCHSLEIEELQKIMQKYPRIQLIVLGGYVNTNTSSNKKIVFKEDLIDFESGCGKISPKYFSIGMNMFYEAQAHNTCLNRKLCIDIDGNIKNCPFTERNFGNIENSTLKEAISKPGFKDLWHIKKDDIDVCKDCEYRYMCSDCRYFITHPENICSQPAKCSYNPYIGLWNGQKGYVSVEECGTFDKKGHFTPNYEKIRMFNKKIKTIYE